MKNCEIHPQLRSAYAFIPSLPVHNYILRPLVNFISLQVVKTVVSGVTITDHKLSQSSVRVYKPDGKHSEAGLLWIHGGGMIMGAPSLNDRECSRYAKDLGITVVSVGYRLAPKFKYPCAIDDCYEAWSWFQESSISMGVDPKRIAVSGQSAGGGLAASLVHKIHDMKGVQPVGQALLSPMLDDRTAARRELDKRKHRLWNNRSNFAGWSMYLGRKAGGESVPDYAVPARRRDMADLPPAWIGVGDIDLFYAECKVYNDSLIDSGGECELYVVPMAPHGFEGLVFDAPITREFYQKNYQFLGRVLDL